MKSLLLLTTLLLSTTIGIYAQNAQIQGSVMDGTEPAIAATVILFAQDSIVDGFYTDENGRFLFRNLASGNYQIIINYDIYNDTLPVLGVRFNEIRELGVIDIISDDVEVGIIDTRNNCCPFSDWTGSPSGAFYNRDQIRQNPAR